MGLRRFEQNYCKFTIYSLRRSTILINLLTFSTDNPKISRPSPQADMRENSKVKIHFLKHTCVQLLNVVRIVHNESIIHGDLKPQHFVTTSCNTFKLIDFGISARVGREGVVRYAGSVSGTLDYMGPECFTYVGKGRSKRVVEISMVCLVSLSIHDFRIALTDGTFILCAVFGFMVTGLYFL